MNLGSICGWPDPRSWMKSIQRRYWYPRKLSRNNSSWNAQHLSSWRSRSAKGLNIEKEDGKSWLVTIAKFMVVTYSENRPWRFLSSSMRCRDCSCRRSAQGCRREGTWLVQVPPCSARWDACWRPRRRRRPAACSQSDPGCVAKDEGKRMVSTR